MDGDILRPGWPCIRFPKLGLNDEIPRVVIGQFETKIGLFIGRYVLFV